MYVDADSASFKEVIEKYPFLNRYTSPMKRMERSLVGRNQEMRSLKAAFNRAELSNVLLLAEAGSGKAIDNDELLPVNDARGYIRMGDVKVGDEVFDEDGLPTTVVGVFPQGKCHAYEVEFFDGSRVVCNDEHIWRVEDVGSHFRRKPKYFNSTLRKLIDQGLYDETTGASLWYVPVCDALRRNRYIEAVRDDAEHYGDAVGRTLSIDVEAGYPMSDDDLRAFLYADVGIRQVFLDAVLRRIPSDVHPYTGTITVRVGSGKLAEQLRQMWTSMGTRSVVEGEDLKLYPSLRSMGISMVYDLQEEREMTCIYVSSASHTFVVGHDHIVTHNTALVQGAMDTDPNRIYLEVDLSRMIADTTNVDEISDKLKRLFAESSTFGKEEQHEVVLFMDEFHQIVQMSAVAVEALKPLLADSATRGIHVVAATTYAEFMQYISSNQPLVERLQRINLSEVDRETTVAILKGMAQRYGIAGKVLDENIYGLIYEYTNRYVPANAQPRKSILVLDSMIGWHRSENRPIDMHLLADVIYESEGVNVAFRVDPTSIKEKIDEKVYAQDFATASIAQRLQLCVADLNDKSKTMSNFLFCGSTGTGKLCTNDTLVPVIPSRSNTLHFKRHGDLKVGDMVVDRKGKSTKVLGTFKHKGVDIFRVTLSDGRTLDVGDSHLWAIHCDGDGFDHTQCREIELDFDDFDDVGDCRISSTQSKVKTFVMTTKQLREIYREVDCYVPAGAAVKWPEKTYAVPPYVAGVLLGGATLEDDMVHITFNRDIWAVGFVKAAGITSYVKRTDSNGRCVLDIVSGSDCDKYIKYIHNVCESRRIFNEYMIGSVEQRCDFMSGLMVTVGHTDAHDGVWYDVPTKSLVDDIREMLFSLGVSSHVVNGDDGTSYQVFRDCISWIDISDIEYIGKQDAQCIYVDNDEHLYQAGQFIVTHNTEVTKQMAHILFGDAQRHLIRLDCTEFANSDSLERFRLELTTRVWERPYCIILLDEIEKACAEVTRMLLSVLDDARLTDRNGRVVSFNNAYIVMTTNAGSEIFKTIAQYEASDTGSGEFLARYDKLIRKSLISAVGSNRFPPELLGRVNCIVPFQPLSEATMRRIVLNKLSELKRDLFNKHHVEMKVSQKVVDYLVLDSLDTDSDSGGARAVISKLESEVATAVARFVNSHPGVPEISVKVEGEMASENKKRAVSEAYIKVVGVREARVV